MLDEKTLRKRVWLRLLGSPLTIVPFLLGMTTLTTTWALDWKPGIGMFAGLAGLLAAGGAFLTRLLLSAGRVTREVATQLEREDQDARQRSLDELDRRLSSADQDPRPEAALRDLRALVKAFEEGATDYSRSNAGSVIDIHSRVGELFDHCVESLCQTERLWQTAQKLNTVAARKPILHQREKIIEEIQASIKQLSDTLVALQTLGAGDRSPAELGRLRDELDQSLAVAKTVEERVNNLVKETGVKTDDYPLHYKPKP
jgi:hypothetical protein